MLLSAGPWQRRTVGICFLTQYQVPVLRYPDPRPRFRFIWSKKPDARQTPYSGVGGAELKGM